MRYRNGSTLIEVVVGAMILVMAAAVIGNVMLSTFMVKRSDKLRYDLSVETAALREHLKNYVTADTSIVSNAPGFPPWHMPEDSSCASCWALSPGVHDVTSRLPAGLRADYKATLKYTVSIKDYHGRNVSNVRIETSWELPQQ